MASYIKSPHPASHGLARPELANCLRALRAGDTLTVWRLDRLGRSLSDLVTIVNDLEKRGIAFESLSERIDTSSASGKLIFHVFASMAEFDGYQTFLRITSRPKAALVHNAQTMKLHSSNEMVIKSIEDDSGINCKDVASRLDGRFTFTVFRKDREDQGRWTLVGDYSGLQFGSEDQVLREAAAKIPWLAKARLFPVIDWHKNH